MRRALAQLYLDPHSERRMSSFAALVNRCDSEVRKPARSAGCRPTRGRSLTGFTEAAEQQEERVMCSCAMCDVRQD